MALLAYHESTEYPASLDRAIAVMRAAVAEAGQDDPDRGTYLSNPAVALNRRSADGTPRALREALDAATAAVELLRPGHPFRAGAGLNLGIMYETRYERSAAEQDYLRAVRAWRAAVADRTSPTADRLAAARRWAEFTGRLSRWDPAVEAYRSVTGLMPLLAWRGVGRADQERLLAGHRGAASDALAACLAPVSRRRAFPCSNSDAGRCGVCC
jgi:hypothetical protein